MAASYVFLSDVHGDKQQLNVRVRVVRLWAVPAFNNANVVGSLEMIFLDEQGVKMHATVRKPLVYRFKNLLTEGRCYNIYSLAVAPNLGSYRTTMHASKFIFHVGTRVALAEIPSIPTYALKPTQFCEILSDSLNSDYLIDVVGLLTGMSQARDYERDGKSGKMVVLELTSENEKIECALFGEYVDQIRSLTGNKPLELPIVVLEMVKVKSFRGKVGLQNVMWATKVMLNPDFEEVHKFRDSISIDGANAVKKFVIYSESILASTEDDFMKLNPRADIATLTANDESGCFIVLATIKTIVDNGPWWYAACKCGKTMVHDADVSEALLYFCDSCEVYSFTATPRYKVKVEVEDKTGTAIFVLFEKDVGYLIKKTCAELFMENMRSVEAVRNNFYPFRFAEIIGKKLLFKVETKVISPNAYHGTFRVNRISDDETMISMFSLRGSDLSPMKSLIMPKSTSSTIDDKVKSFVEIGDVAGSSTVNISNELSAFSNVTSLQNHDNAVAKGKAIAMIESAVDLTPTKRNLEDDFNEVANSPNNGACKTIKFESG